MFTIPDRIAGSMTGTQFAASIMDMPLGPERELAIFQQLSMGNVPSFMRTSSIVRLEGAARVIEVEVLPDVLCVGTDSDFVRVPLNPKTAQKVANAFDGVLITPTLSSAIWLQASVRIDPMHVTMPPGNEMTSTKWFLLQNDKIEKERAGRGGLIAGHKKDVVLANALSKQTPPDSHVAIYGWHMPNGVPIQGLNPTSHAIWYADYSHGIRLISEDLTVNGDIVSFYEAVGDPTLAPLLNTEGVLTYTRYPTA